jgi:hypothetical protein
MHGVAGMSDEPSVSSEHERAAKILQELEVWRLTHPGATFAEIEAGVEARLDALRAHLIEHELALRAAAESAEGAERPACPTCGRQLQARGTADRAVTVRGNRPVRLQRRYAVCPACSAGHFPPR